MADNLIRDPFLNPVWFYDPDKVNDPAFFTKHFEDYPFEERLLEWEDPLHYKKIWQSTDIIYLQFESEFDPIIIELEDSGGTSVITLPALVGLPNIYFPGTYSYEVEMSLGTVETGCYRMKRTRGSGDEQKVDYSPYMYISGTPFEFPTFLIQYWHSRAHADVMFETGIKFQMRIPGNFGRLKPGRNTEAYRDQKQNPAILSSRTFKSFPAYFGDEFGLPDDEIDLLNAIWGCDNVLIDGKPFAAVDTEFEFFEADSRYAKRGVKLLVQEGLNRDSKIFSQTLDTSKKLNYGIVVEAKVWGDTSNQGSANTVPINTVE